MPVKAARPVILNSAARCITAVQSDEYVKFAIYVRSLKSLKFIKTVKPGKYARIAQRIKPASLIEAL